MMFRALIICLLALPAAGFGDKTPPGAPVLPEVLQMTAQDDAAAQDQPMQRHTASFRFSLVRIPVWVNDKSGRTRTNLERNDFRVYVDGEKVKFDGFFNMGVQPLELAFLLDLSGSMGMGGKVEGSVETLDWLFRTLDPRDRYRLYAFSDQQIVRVLDQDQLDLWPERRKKLRGYGKTALYDALAVADRFFESDSLSNRAVVLFTDGNDNRSKLSQSQMLQVLSVLDVPIFVVAIADGYPKVLRDESLGLHTLKEIAKVSGGELFVVQGVDQLPNIRQTLERHLRPQYMLTMTVERGPDEQRHHIEVRLPGRRSLNVRSRTGYMGFRPIYGGK